MPQREVGEMLERFVGHPSEEERGVIKTGKSRHSNKQSRPQSVQARLLWFDQRESSPMDLCLCALLSSYIWLPNQGE